jgi:hypothetical protein
MQVEKAARLIWTFYKNFLFSSLIITTCCLSAFWKYSFSAFSGLFWLKITTLALTYYFINQSKNKEYHYYQNLGISKLLLWASTFLFDFALFISLIILIHNFR